MAGGRRSNAEQQALVGAGLRRRVLVVEQLLHVGREVRAREEGDLDVALEAHAARLLHLLLQRRAVDALPAHERAEERVDELGRVAGGILPALLLGGGRGRRLSPHGRSRPARDEEDHDPGDGREAAADERAHERTSVRSPVKRPRIVYSVSTSAREA